MSHAYSHRKKFRAKARKLYANTWQGPLKERIRQILEEKKGGDAYRSIETLISVENVNVHTGARILHRSPKHVLVLLRAGLLHASAWLNAGNGIRMAKDALQSVVVDADWAAQANVALKAHHELKEAKRRAYKEAEEKKRAERAAQTMVGETAAMNRSGSQSEPHELEHNQSRILQQV